MTNLTMVINTAISHSNRRGPGAGLGPLVVQLPPGTMSPEPPWHRACSHQDLLRHPEATVELSQFSWVLLDRKDFPENTKNIQPGTKYVLSFYFVPNIFRS